MKARDVMAGGLITCPPDASVSEAAKLMRDRDTGDVLITDKGKLLGIVTDRDIAIRAAAEGDDPSQEPVRRYMSKRVVTGNTKWDLNRVANTMAKHQIRRLPIEENGRLVGIISLGDVALNDKDKSKIAKSLRAISEPKVTHRLRSGRNRLMGTLGLALLVGTVVALTMSPKSMSNLIERSQDAWERAQDNWDRVQDSQAWSMLLDFAERGRERLSQMSA